jgi:hypothetical protein
MPPQPSPPEYPQGSVWHVAGWQHVPIGRHTLPAPQSPQCATEPH